MTRHNASQFHLLSFLVVNCFQKLLSSWHDTTTHKTNSYGTMLWIAFKNYYLRDTTQLTLVESQREDRCELLSKIIIFVTRHNSINEVYKWLCVVNCFQKLLSSWHDTTQLRGNLWWVPLWIAFKNYYLRDTTQLMNWNTSMNMRCELLSKIIIFVTRHNLHAPSL